VVDGLETLDKNKKQVNFCDKLQENALLMGLMKLHEIYIRLDNGPFYSKLIKRFYKVKIKILKRFSEQQYSAVLEVFDQIAGIITDFGISLITLYKTLISLLNFYF
jgi:hypothetical protein